MQQSVVVVDRRRLQELLINAPTSLFFLLETARARSNQRRPPFFYAVFIVHLEKRSTCVETHGAAGVQLTAQERKRLEVNKQVLELARDKHRHEPKSDGYQLPDSYEDEQGRIDTRKREDVLTARRVQSTSVHRPSALQITVGNILTYLPSSSRKKRTSFIQIPPEGFCRVPAEAPRNSHRGGASTNSLEQL